LQPATTAGILVQICNILKKVLILIFKKWNRLAFFLSLYGTIGFSISVAVPTFLDPILKHPIYGYRTYPMSFLCVFLILLNFTLIYRTNLIESDLLKIGGRNAIITNRSIFSFLSMIICMSLTFPIFLPEFPHMWIFINILLYSILVGLSSYAWGYEPDFSFVQNKEIDIRARLERLKIAYNSFYAIIALLVALSVGVISMPKTSSIYLSAGEVYLLEQASWINTYYALFGIFFGICYPVLKHMYKVQEQFNYLRSQ